MINEIMRFNEWAPQFLSSRKYLDFSCVSFLLPADVKSQTGSRFVYHESGVKQESPRTPVRIPGQGNPPLPRPSIHSRPLAVPSSLRLDANKTTGISCPTPRKHIRNRFIPRSTRDTLTPSPPQKIHLTSPSSHSISYSISIQRLPFP